MPANLKQIAAKAGVSVGTVSFVLNGKGDEFRISKETQERVKLIAKELNYIPKERKSYKPTDSKDMRIVLLVASRSSGEHYGTFFACLQNAMYELSCPVQLSMQAYIPGNLRECHAICGDHCDGVIIAGLNDADYAYLHELQTDLPIVLYNRESCRFPYVIGDSYHSTASVISLFASHGRKHICMVSPLADSTGFNRHLLGFANGCATHNVEHASIHFCEYSSNGARDVVNQLLAHSPDAIFVSSLQIATPLLLELQSRGMLIPEQVDLVSVSPYDTNDSRNSPITTLDIPANEMISAALNMLVELICSKTCCPYKSFPLDITFRSSCKE